MSVYYVHAPDLGLVKIGVAVDPRSRFHQLQSNSPSRLVLLAFEDGGADLEAARHRQFAPLRKRGEWFAYEGDLAVHVAALPPYIQRRRRTPLPGPIGAWMFKNCVSQEEFAKLIGTTGGTVSRICAGKICPGKFVRIIFEITNGEVDANALYGLMPDLPTEAAA